jgi:hypothetical protein
MKIISWILFFIDAYLGIYNLLNALYILQSSKYSQTATIVFAILFLGLSAAIFYFLFIKKNYKAAFYTGLGPWLFALIFLFINMLTADYK